MAKKIAGLRLSLSLICGMGLHQICILIMEEFENLFRVKDV